MMSLMGLYVATYLTYQDINKPTKPLTTVIEGREIKREEIKDNHKQWINIVATAYSASPDENGGRVGGITASGLKASNSRGTIAVPSDIKFFTKLHIPDLNKTFVSEDRGNSRFIRWIDKDTIRIDIFMNSKRQAKDFGVQKFRGYFIIENPNLSIDN